MTLWSKKKGILEKFAIKKVSTTILGRASPHDELLQRQPTLCSYNSKSWPTSATIGNPCLYITFMCSIASNPKWLNNWRNN
jgi:hypothetical protein